MITRIQSIHFNADEKLISLIETRISKLTHYIQDKAIEAKVILRLEQVGQIQDKIVEIIINLPGKPIVAKCTKKSFEEALTEVVAVLKKLLVKYKEKIQKKHV